MADLKTQQLPDYENPPVDEVVCGVLFEPLKTFLLPHFGLLWEKKFRQEYPGLREMAPLIPIVESFEEAPSQQKVEVAELPLPRVWFMHDDGRIIQVQRDRFLHNWRKLQPTDEYPRYEKVFKMFQSHFASFQDFLNDIGVGPVAPCQYEMTYVNIIPQGQGWETDDDIGKVFRDFCWRREKQRFLPHPDSIDWQSSFPLPNQAGRLRMHIQSGIRRTDNRRVFRFELTARGIGSNTAPEKMQEWFDLAHEWIVRGFADLTTPQIQRDAWGLKQ
jgi:uncharacterized protein (TIGR04255 family)